nr:hypothetical protein [Rhodothermus marinus]
MVELVERAGLLHGYLEDQLFTPTIRRGREIIWKRGAALTGRPYLARAAEEHSGPHAPWFWFGNLQGGGVLNDMMCHSVEVARFLLTEPGKPRQSIRPVKVTAQIASLKWSRPEYAAWLREHMDPRLDYEHHPAEDFARATIEFVDEDGRTLIAETTTSWSYVGPGLRLTAELLGPEYSLQVNSLDTGARLFFSRRVQGEAARISSKSRMPSRAGCRWWATKRPNTATNGKTATSCVASLKDVSRRKTSTQAWKWSNCS